MCSKMIFSLATCLFAIKKIMKPGHILAVDGGN